MKWKSYKKLRKVNHRPFLVLSFTENFDQDTEKMPKNPGLRLFTKTWATKTKEDNNENSRPLTATLDKPQVLDISLITKIDMSLVRKEFLSITNLCRVPLTVNMTRAKRKPLVFNQRRCALNRPSLPATVQTKKSSRLVASDDSWEDEESSSSRTKSLKNTGKLAKMNTNVKSTTPKEAKSSGNDANNNLKTYKITRKRTTCKTTIDSKVTKLPEPCKTCGRLDQPERFHSHPIVSPKPAKKMEENVKISVKNSVQKPIAIKYKSKLLEKTTNQKNNSSPIKKHSAAPKTVHTLPSVTISSEDSSNRPKTAKGPKTLTCYVCGREFGTMSLPLHEPKCLEKWARENDSLPSHLRRKRPVKPDRPLTKEEWNAFAWESSQANLVPCGNCKRTFFPDRLVVHQRSCKAINSPNMSKFQTEDASASSTPSTPPKPRHVSCSVCGRMFGTKSIKIHEPQCLKKWHLQNDHLPPSQREPLHKEIVGINEAQSVSPQLPKTEEKRNSPTKPPMFPCYLCGRLFSVNSIYIHEPQCLKKWRTENEKLPVHKRRQEPLKPDIKFTHEGKVDNKATVESKWLSHLSQLIPCKFCGRTFNPDRVEVHERSCKG